MVNVLLYQCLPIYSFFGLSSDNVDLMVYALRAGIGYTGNIMAGSNTPYAIELRQKHVSFLD